MLLLAGCGGEAGGREAEPEPRSLTPEEAELLAVVRFRLYRASPVPVLMEWPGRPSSSFAVTLDLKDHRAYGRFTTSEDGQQLEEGFVAWSFDRLATALPSAAGSSGDQVPAEGEWQMRSITTSVPRDILLLLALNLGSDRPENPLLLQQSSARFLRQDRLGDQTALVLEGPIRADGEPSEDRSSRLRFWVSEEGDPLRVEAYLGDAEGEWATIDLTDPHPQAEELRARAESVLSAGMG